MFGPEAKNLKPESKVFLQPETIKAKPLSPETVKLHPPILGPCSWIVGSPSSACHETVELPNGREPEDASICDLLDFDGDSTIDSRSSKTNFRTAVTKKSTGGVSMFCSTSPVPAQKGRNLQNLKRQILRLHKKKHFRSHAFELHHCMSFPSADTDVRKLLRLLACFCVSFKFVTE